MWTNTKLKLLRAPELVEQADANNEMEPGIISRGLKFRYPENTAEEWSTVQAYQDDLRKVLSVERISIRNSRSIAMLENGKIKITKRVGKSYLVGVHDYLEPHEALFLMEINRLEVYDDSIIVSLERGYKIFLANDSNVDQDDRLTLSEYLVFSHFARAGCNLKRYTVENVAAAAQASTQAHPNIIESSQSSSASGSNDLYVWNYLYELLGHRKQVIPFDMSNNEVYMRIKSSMDTIVKTFRSHSSAVCDIKMNDDGIENETAENRKREFDSDAYSPNPSKLMKLCHLPEEQQYAEQYFGSGPTNDFMSGNEFNKFKEIFNKIDVIKLKRFQIDELTISNQLKFSFDFWTVTDHQATKCNRPNFRIIISDSPKSLPRSDDILRLYHNQIHKAAIIIVCLNEEMSFQAYVYRFTT